MPVHSVNRPIPIKEISSEQVEKIEGKYGGWFYLVKVIVQPCHEFKELTEWWQVHREGPSFERRMVAHGPTKEIATEQLEELNNSQFHSWASRCWSIPWKDLEKCQEMEAELKKIKSQKDLERAQQQAIEAEKEKKRAEARQRLKEQKERIELLEKVGETDRFTGLEI